MTKVVSLRLKDPSLEALQRAARRMGRTPSEAAALLLDEALRQAEFAFIDFRTTPAGRQAHIQGTRLKVWQVTAIARDYAGDVAATAAHLAIPAAQVAAALNYAKAFPEEIAAAIGDNERSDAELERLVPNLEVVGDDASAA